MCQYLTPPRKGVYYFRRPIPERLRPIIGQREWFYSLKVKDREEAKRLIPYETIRTDQLLAAAEKALAEAVPKDPEQLARQRRAEVAQRRFEEQERAHDEARREDDAEAARLEAEQLARIDAQEAERLHMEYIVLTGKTGAMPPELAVMIRAVRDARGELAVKDEHLLIAQSQLRERAAGDSQGAEIAAGLPSVPKSPSASQRTREGNSAAVTVTGLYKAYATTRLSPSVVKEGMTKVGLFVAFLGHDDAARVTADDIHRWKNHVRDEVLPSGKKRSAQTVNSGFLSPLRSAFKHGVDERLIAQNPARDVARVSQAKAPKIREKDFTREEQRTILAAASATDTSEGGRQALVRRWVPWICAYTGARVNEITQLRAEDVQQIDGHWVIKITPEAGRVKTNEVRYVPVHEHLLEQGFLAVVNQQKEGPIFYDPERGDPESERGQYKKSGERLAAWVRSLGITDPGIKPNHAWRHTFKTIANEVGVQERAADYMQGHASKGVGRSYGRNTIKALVDQMALMPRFEID
ncbi:MAG: tyrosine-type recombinase/integrase [Sphingobium sp.]|nr:tyrosine-type recombinase/integrase [Sphingobium sp.]